MPIADAILAGIAVKVLSDGQIQNGQNGQNQQMERRSAVEPAGPAEAKDGPNRAVPTSTPPEDADPIEKLLAVQQKDSPSPKALDGYDTTTTTLNDGQTVVITTTPVSGLRLKVVQIEFDRINNFTYRFNVDGDLFGGDNANRVKFESPRVVSPGGNIVSQATNSSGSQKTFDWEIRAWGEPV